MEGVRQDRKLTSLYCYDAALSIPASASRPTSAWPTIAIAIRLAAGTSSTERPRYVEQVAGQVDEHEQNDEREDDGERGHDTARHQPAELVMGWRCLRSDAVPQHLEPRHEDLHRLACLPDQRGMAQMLNWRCAFKAKPQPCTDRDTAILSAINQLTSEVTLICDQVCPDISCQGLTKPRSMWREVLDNYDR